MTQPIRTVLRSRRYLQDLSRQISFIAAKDKAAAARLRERIDGQVAKLADPKYPRRIGRKPGTYELVAHRNYIVVFEQSESYVLILGLLHARMSY